MILIDSDQRYEIVKKLSKINSEKRIPISAGLGGGSSDAAATLLELNKFFNLRLSNDTLFQIALSLAKIIIIAFLKIVIHLNFWAILARKVQRRLT